MSKPKSIQINVPHPCSQSWDEMEPSSDGRHCAQCNKSVIDFTTWSDAALYNFFASQKGEICGRYLNTQVDRPILIPYQPHSRLYMLTIALGLTLIFTQSPDALAQNRAPQTEQTSIIKQQPDLSALDFGTIAGQVIDEKKEPLIHAPVQVFQDGKLMGGNVTDYDGNFVIKPLKPGRYDILIFYQGCDSLLTKNVLVSECQITNFYAQLSRQPVRLRQFVITGGGKPLIDRSIAETVILPAAKKSKKATKVKH